MQKRYKDALGDYLLNRYNDYCMAVHPSALTSLQHTLFASSQQRPDEKQITYLFSELFSAQRDYLQILERLCAHLDKNGLLAMTPTFKATATAILTGLENTKAAWSERVKALDPRDGD